MQKLTQYNGIDIVTPTPLDEGGGALNNNFKALSTHFDTGVPGSTNDLTEGFRVGSRWYDDSTSEEWICTDDTQDNALWERISLLGPQGPQGPQGFQGDTGPQGAQGFQGDTGPQGPQGTQGFQGDAGAMGPQGAQGDAGPLGAAGAQGPQGDPGATGAQGAQGDAGPQGATGATGPQGPQGDAGPQGPQGAQGTQGPQGPIAGAGVYWNYSTTTVATGYVTESTQLYFNYTDHDGNNVKPLLMALTVGSYMRVYDVADPAKQVLWELTSGPTDNPGSSNVSFTYSTVESVGWSGANVLALVCPTIRGADGAQGNQGFQGAQGDAGAQGPQGNQGAAGTQGFQGDTGLTGPQGFQGDAGPQGPQGDKTAILDIDGEYLGLFCSEAPQSYFFDVMEIPAGGSHAIDRKFVAACEPGTIRVWATHCDKGTPGDLQCRVVDDRVVLKSAAAGGLVRV